MLAHSDACHCRDNAAASKKGSTPHPAAGANLAAWQSPGRPGSVRHSLEVSRLTLRRDQSRPVPSQTLCLRRTMGPQLAMPVAILHAFAFGLGYWMCKFLGFNEKTARTVSIETGALENAAPSFLRAFVSEGARWVHDLGAQSHSASADCQMNRSHPHFPAREALAIAVACASWVGEQPRHRCHSLSSSRRYAERGAGLHAGPGALCGPPGGCALRSVRGVHGAPLDRPALPCHCQYWPPCPSCLMCHQLNLVLHFVPYPSFGPCVLRQSCRCNSQRWLCPDLSDLHPDPSTAFEPAIDCAGSGRFCPRRVLAHASR